VLISRAVLKNNLQELAREIEPSTTGDAPSVESFYRWRKRWIRANFDIRALIDKFELRGRRPRMDYPQRLIDLITQGIETFYLTTQRESKRELHDWIDNRVRFENRTRAPDDALPKVSPRLINRFLGQYDRYSIIKARYGERIARQSTRTFGLGPQCERPLQRVEVDNTPLDIVVIDQRTGLVLGRPWITVMIDKYSRMVIGYHLSFRTPSAESVLRCVRHAVLPKTYVKERFPAISGEWECFGLIEELICDNGLEFHANDLEAACAALGTHIIYCPTRSPYLKGAIERFLKTLNYSLLHTQPGTTFAKYYKREYYDTLGNATLTFAQLDELLHRWIIDVYSIDFHRGINTAPQQRWQEGVRCHPPRLPPNPEQLKIHLGRVVRRKLDKSGIQVLGLSYNSDALSEVLRRRGDCDVIVRIDPDDLQMIYVLDETKKVYIEAICSISSYADGLTIEQHGLIQKKGREDYRSLPHRDQLLAAKAALREFTRSLLDGSEDKSTAGKKNRRVAKHARDLLQDQAMSGNAGLGGIPDSESASTFEIHGENNFFDLDFPEFAVENRQAFPFARKH